MQRWTSDPLDLPMAREHVARAHLEFQDTRVDGPSFTAYTFLNAGRELPADAGRDHPSFAGAFTVFAYGDCWGTEGHCDWMRPSLSPFDRRPEHHLQPVTFTVDITDALPDEREIVVTVHAAHLSDREATEVVRFERLALYAYQ